MRLELAVVIPDYGTYELATISAFIQQHDQDGPHPWGGILHVGDRNIGAVSGLIQLPLSAPNRGGAKPKIERDIAVFLARKHFKARGVDDPKDTVDRAVVKLWKTQRACSVLAVSDHQALRVNDIEKEMPLERLGPGPKETHKGIGEVGHVSRIAKEVEKDLAGRILGVIGGVGSRDEDSLMILLLRGGGLERAAEGGDRAALRGPFWAWKLGEEEAEYFGESDSFEVCLGVARHGGWHADGSGQLVRSPEPIPLRPAGTSAANSSNCVGATQ